MENTEQTEQIICEDTQPVEAMLNRRMATKFLLAVMEKYGQQVEDHELKLVKLRCEVQPHEGRRKNLIRQETQTLVHTRTVKFQILIENAFYEKEKQLRHCELRKFANSRAGQEEQKELNAMLTDLNQEGVNNRTKVPEEIDPEKDFQMILEQPKEVKKAMEKTSSQPDQKADTQSAKMQLEGFIKTNEVRKIMQDALLTLTDKINKQTLHYRSNHQAIVDMDNKMKSVMQQVIGLQKIKENYNVIHKHFKHLENRIEEQRLLHTVESGRFVDMKEVVDLKIQGLSETVEELKNYRTPMEKKIDELQKKVDLSHDNYQDTRAETQQKFEVKFEAIDQEQSDMRAKIDKAETVFRFTQEKILESHAKSMTKIRLHSQIDSDKLIRLESNMRDIIGLVGQVKVIDHQVTQLSPLHLQMKETRAFIERSLPSLVHLQVMEAIHEHQLGMKNLRDFEKSRLQDLQHYARDNDSKEPSISRLQKKLTSFIEAQLLQNKGVAPFIFGKGRDYWPGDEYPVDKKTNILINRFHLEEDHARTLVLIDDSKTKDLIQDQIKGFQDEMLTQLGIADNKVFSNRPSSRLIPKQATGKSTSPTVPTLPQRHNSSFLNYSQKITPPSRVESPLKKKQSSQFPNSKLISMLAHLKDQNSTQQITQVVESAKDEALSSSDQSVSVETPNKKKREKGGKQCVHRVQVVQKLDTKRLSMIKRKANLFMEQGREEFTLQLGKFQDLFLENTADIDDLADQQNTFDWRVNQIERQFRKITDNPLITQQAAEVSNNTKLWDTPDLFTAQKEGNNEAFTFFIRDLEQRLMRLEMDLVSLQRRPPSVNYQPASSIADIASREPQQPEIMLSSLSLSDQGLKQTTEHSTEDFVNTKIQIIDKDVETVSKKGKTPRSKPSTKSMINGRESLAEQITDMMFQPTQKENETNKSLNNTLTVQKKSPSKKMQSSVQMPQRRNTVHRTPSNRNLASALPKNRAAPNGKQSIKFSANLTKAESRQQSLMNTDQLAQATRPLSPGDQKSNTRLALRRDDPNSEANKLRREREKAKAIQGSQQRSNSTKKAMRTTFTHAQNRVGGESNSRNAFVQQITTQLNSIVQQFHSWIGSVDQRHEQATKEKEELVEYNETQFKLIRQEQSVFINKVTTEVHDTHKLLRAQTEETMERYNSNLHLTVKKVDNASQIVHDMKDKFDSDYMEHFRERKRWKSDFLAASEKAINNFNQIEGLVSQTLKENAINTNAVKLMLDAVMIDQLIFKQDIEDRKSIGMMGVKSPYELSTDRTLRDSPRKRVEAMFEAKTEDIDLRDLQPELTTEKTKTKPVKHPVITLDKSCLSCSGNMNQTLMQFKIACLTYTQQPIAYRDRHYHVSDLLGLRAETISACQRLIRANIKGGYNMGEQIRQRSDEQAFVIEPIMQLTSIEDIQNSAMMSKLKNDTTYISHAKDFLPQPKHVIEALQPMYECRSGKNNTIQLESERDNTVGQLDESIHLEYAQPIRTIHPNIIMRIPEDEFETLQVRSNMANSCKASLKPNDQLKDILQDKLMTIDSSQHPVRGNPDAFFEQRKSTRSATATKTTRKVIGHQRVASLIENGATNLPDFVASAVKPKARGETASVSRKK